MKGIVAGSERFARIHRQDSYRRATRYEEMSQQLLLSGGRLIDTDAGEVIEDAAVLVDPPHVVSAGPIEDVPHPDDAREIDATGKTLLPGLVDSHAHLTYTATTLRDGLQFTDPKNSLPYNTVGAVENARINLQRGVTSIRDPGSRGEIAVAIRDAVEDGIIEGPRVRASGPIVSTTGGLTDTLPSWIDSDTGFMMRTNGPEEAVEAVREQAKMGVDNVKIEASGEWISQFADSRTPTMRPAEIEAVVDVAHSRGLSVAAHAKAREAIENCARAGVDTIEHGTFLDEETADLLVENDVAMTGTLTGQIDIAEKAVEVGGQPEHLVQQLQSEIATLKEAVRLAHDRGVTVITGTDSGPPHSAQGNVSEELGHLVEHGGFTPMEAVVAGTKTTAEVIDLPDVGVLAPDYRADLLVLDADPLADIHALADPENIDCVIKDGEVVRETA